MSISRHKPMPREAFPAWERRREMRHEFDGSEPVLMNCRRNSRSLRRFARDGEKWIGTALLDDAGLSMPATGVAG
jgi:uncharacterized protein with von Willebrand factor type A (vWA) domain